MAIEHDPVMFGKKRCTKCELVKPSISFSVAKENVDGLDSRCRECVAEYARKRRKASRLKRPHTELSFRHKTPKGHTFQDWEDVT